MTVEALVARYGLAALLVGAGLEGETVVVVGGMLAHRGFFPLAGAMAAAALGSFAADQLFFALGRRYRDRPRVAAMRARPAFARALGWLERHPVSFIFAFRFLYGLRTISPVAIGTSAVPARRFLWINAAAAIVWGCAFTTIGYLFGHAVEALLGRWLPDRHHLVIAGGAAIAAMAAAGWWHWRRTT